MDTQRGETDFFSGEPLRALSTLVFSDNVDLQRSASLTFAEITERGKQLRKKKSGTLWWWIRGREVFGRPLP